MPAASPTRTDRRWEEALEEHRVALAAFLDTAGRVDEVEERVRRWAREGWKLTEPPERICAWLRGG